MKTTTALRTRKTARTSARILAGSIAALLTVHSALAQNTVDNYTGVATGSLLTPGNWSLVAVPLVTNDAVFSLTEVTGIRTMSAGDLTVGSFNVLAPTGTFSIRNETAGATDSNLTLGGVGNLGNSVSGTAADLLYAATGSTFNIIGANGGGGTGLLKLILGQSGNFNIAGTSTISSVISDGGFGFGFTKTGAGILTLQNASTYTGATTITTGTLQLGTGVTLQNGSVASTSIVNNAALIFNNADAQSYSGVISGVGTLTKTGAGTLTLSNANTITGTTTITTGILQLGTGVTGQNGSLASASIVNNSTLNFNNFDAQTYSGVISGGGALTKTAAGTLILSGENTYTGATAISVGVLNVQRGAAMGTGAVTVTGGAALQIEGTYNIANTLTLNGTGVGNTGALRNISGISKYTGAITLGSPTRINSDAGILRTTNTINNAGFGLTVGGAGDTSLWGAVSGAGALTMDGTGRLQLATNHTYTGGTNINGGVVFLTSATALGTAGTISFGGGTLQYSIANTVDYSARFSTASQAIKIDTSNQAQATSSVAITFATPMMSGTNGSLTVSGISTLNLTALNTYTGATTVRDTATLGLNLNTAAGNNVVSSSSALTLGGNLSVTGPGGVTVRSQTFNGTTFGAGNATITPVLVAASATANVLTINLGTLSRTAGGTGNILFTSNVDATNTQINTGTGSASALVTDANGVAYMTADGNVVNIRNWAVKDATNTKIVVAPGGFYTAATATTIAGNADIGALSPTITGAVGDNAVASIRFDNAGASTLTLNGATSSFSVGGILVSQNVGNNATIITGTGTLRGPTAGAGDLVIHNWDPSNSVTVSMPIGGTGGFTTAGSGTGTVILSAANSYTGPTTIGGGTLQVGNAGTTGDLGGTTGTITNNGTLTFNRSSASSVLTIANAITGTGALTQNGTGTTILQGALNYRGLTTVNAGTLTFDTGSVRSFTSKGNSGTSGNNRRMDGNGLQVNNGTVNVGGLVDVESVYITGGVINVLPGGDLVNRQSVGNGFFGLCIGGNEYISAAYGMLNMTGGTVSNINDLGISTGPRFGVGVKGTAAAVLRVSGGILNAIGLGVGSAEITQLGGSIRTAGGSAPILQTENFGANGFQTSVLNVAGGTFDNGTLGLDASGGTAGSSKTIINMNAGTLWTRAVTQAAGGQAIMNFNGGTLKVGAASAIFTPAAINNTTSTYSNYVNGAFGTYAGGAVIDTNGFAITLPNALLAPTGSGVTAIALPGGGGGALYVGAPMVTISDAGTALSGTTGALNTTVAMANTTGVFVGQSITGTGIPLGSIVTSVTANTSITISQNATASGSPTLTFRGQGATAYATYSGGAVTGYVVTNPGVGYVGTLSTTLSGGFATGGTAATAPANANFTTAANTSGGLTKNGLSTLTLSGADTFSGAIAVNAGTLIFNETVINTYGAISGLGAITQSGTGVTVLGGTGTYSGLATLTAGVLRLNAVNALPGGLGATGGTSALTFSGGVLGLGAGNYSRNLGAAGDVTAANFTGAGGWAAYGADRTVNLGGASSTVIWATANTGFNGQTVILGASTATHTVDLQNPLDLGAAVRTVQVDNGFGDSDGKLSGVLSNGSITKTGLGMLTLSNALNSYTGTTIVNAGILSTGASDVLPNATAVTVSGNAAGVTAVLDLAGNNDTIGTLSFGGSTATSGALVRTGTGTLTLGGDVTYTATNNPLGATISGNLALGATRTFTVNDSTTAQYDLTVSAAISGSTFGVTKANAGTLLLSGANTYTGATIINAGTLQSGNDGALSTTPSVAVNNAGSALAVSYGGASDYTAAQVVTLLAKTTFGATTTAFGFDTANATSAATYSNVLSMAAGVTKLGAGTITLSNNNSYTGATTVVAGTLILSGINTGTGTATVSGGVLRADQGVGLNTGSLLTINGGVFETGANLERTGGAAAGNMQITGGTSGFSANGAAVQVAFGTIASPTALTWGTAPFVPGTFILNGTTANNTLDFKNAVNLGGSARTIQVDANVATMSGVLSNGGVTKTGAGTLVLSNVGNNYAGTTIVNGGTLTLNGTQNTAITLAGGTLRVDAGAGAALNALSTLTLGTLASPGTFIYDNTNATGAKSQTLASLTAANQLATDNTVQITRTAAQNVTLIFTAVTSNTTEIGNVINFVTNDVAGGGVNGTNYKIVLGNGTSATQGAGASAYQTIINQNAYFNGGDFAMYDISAGTGLLGFVRGVNYGVHANSATFAAGVNLITTTNNAQITGSITGQNSVTLGAGGSGTSGTLKINGAFNITMNAGQTLTFNNIGNVGVNGLLKTGGGTSIISGGAAVNLGTVQGHIRVDGVADVLNINMPVTIAGTTRLMKSGLGTLILSNGTLALTDGSGRNRTFINGGIFEIGGTASMNNTATVITLATGTLLKFSSSAPSFIGAGGSVVGLGGVTVSNGILTLVNTNNTYTGVTTLDGGVVNVAGLANGGAGSSIGQSTNAASNLVFGGGTLQHTGSTAALTDRLFTIGTAAGNTATLDASGTTVAAAMTFNNTGAIAFGNTSAHTLTLTGTNVAENTLAPVIGNNTGATSVVKNGVNAWALTGTNTYSGGTTVNAGTLTATGLSALGATTGTLAANNPNTGAGTAVTLNLSSTAPTTTGSLSGTIGTPSSGTNTVTINNGGRLFTVNQTAANTYAGAITGAGGFTLGSLSTNTLTLSGTSTFTGATTVSAGKLSIASTGTINSTSAVSIGAAEFNYSSATALTQGVSFSSTGGTLSGTGTITPAVTVTSGNILSPGNSPGTISFGTGLTIAAGGIFNWENNTINTLGTVGTNWDSASVTGTTTISSTATTGSQLRLLFTDAGTDFTNSFWDTNRTFGSFVTGGVSAGNLFHGTNLTVFINAIQQGATNTIAGQGTFTTAVNGSNLDLLWTISGGGGNNSKLWFGGTEPTTTLETTSTTQAFGRVMLSSAQSAGVTLNSNGSDAATTNGTLGISGDATTTTVTGFISTLSPVNATLSTGSTGVKSGTVTVTNAAVDSAGASQGNDNGVATINVSGTVLANRTLTATALGSLGLQHVGATYAGPATTTVSTLASTAGDDNRATRVTLGGGTDGSLTVASSATVFNTASQSEGRGVTGTYAAAGVISGSFNLTTAVHGSETATGTTPQTTAVTYSASVFNGTGKWTQTVPVAATHAYWGTNANWTDSNTVNAAPGTFAGFDNVDTATFDGTGTVPEIRLNGTSPSVKNVAFSGGLAYTINNTGGGTLILKADAGSAAVSSSSTVTQTISAPVRLDSNTIVSVTNIAGLVSTTGNISQTGSRSLTKNGTGTLDLNGASQAYTTLNVNDGTANVNGTLGATPGTAVVSVTDTAGGVATKLRFGSVSQTLSSLTIGAGATVIFTSGTASGAFSGGGGGKVAGLGGGAVVPEPGTLGLLLVGALGMLNRRRRQA